MKHNKPEKNLMYEVKNTIKIYGNTFLTVQRRFKTTLSSLLKSTALTTNQFILPEVRQTSAPVWRWDTFCRNVLEEIFDIIILLLNHFAIYDTTKVH